MELEKRMEIYRDFKSAKKIKEIEIELERFDIRKHPKYPGKYLVRITHLPGTADFETKILDENDDVKIRYWYSAPDGAYIVDSEVKKFKDILEIA